MKHHSRAASVEERQAYRVVRGTDRSVNTQLVGQRPRRADTFFLYRNAGDHAIQTGYERGGASATELGRWRQKASSGRQADRSVVRVGEVEDRRQVTRHRTAPRGDIALVYSETLFDELDHRGVIEDLGIDVASLAPGRDRDERHALGEADRAARRRRGVRDDLVFDANRRGSLSRCLRRRRRHDVVEAAVGLVVIDDENGFAEYLGIGYQDVQDLGDVPSAVVDRPIRVFGITGRRHDPGNLRQFAARHVAPELVEQVLRPVQPDRRGLPRGRNDIANLGARYRVLEQRGARRGREVLIRIPHRTVAEVADESIDPWVPKIRREGRSGEVLVELPAHAGRLQHFGERLKDEVRMVDAEAVVGDRPGAVPVGAAAAQVVHVADAARKEVVAIRVGGPHD